MSLGQTLSSPTSPKVAPHSPKIEPDSSSRKRDHKSSLKSHKCPVSVAAGSSADLEKSEQEREADRRQWKELWSMRIMPIQKAGARTMSIPLDMSMVGHLNVADLLNLVVLLSIPIRRNNEFS